jgi:hypothetical protein
VPSLCYTIYVEGYLEENWTDWFEGLTVEHKIDADGRHVHTILSARMDQAMLCGILMRICSLAVPLVGVSCSSWQWSDGRPHSTRWEGDSDEK